MTAKPPAKEPMSRKIAYILLALVYPLIHLVSGLITQLLFLFPIQKQVVTELGSAATAEEITKEALSRYAAKADLANLISHLLTIAAVILLFLIIRKVAGKEHEGLSVREYFSLKPVDPLVLILSAILAVGFYHLVIGLIQLIGLIAPSLYESYQNASSSLGGEENRLFGFLSLVITAPLTEELIYRSMTLSHLEKAMPRGVALALTSLLFGLVHGNFIWMLYAALMGAIFGFLFYRCDSVFPSLVMHVVFNFIGFLYSLLDTEKLSEGMVAALNLVSFTLIGLSLLIVPLTLFFILRRTRRKPNL